MKIVGNSLEIKHTALDESDLRMSLLYWDHLEWPQNDYIRIGDPTIDHLISCGVLTRSTARFTGGGQATEIMHRTQSLVFQQLDSEFPGRWAVGRGINSISVFGNIESEHERSILIDLQHAIPVPDGEAAFLDILEFKKRRRPELLALRAEIEDLYLEIIGSPDKSLSEMKAFARIQAATNNLRSVTVEAPFRAMWGSLRGALSFDNLADKALEPAIVAAASGAALFTSSWATGIGAGVATLIVKNGYKALKNDQSVVRPYEYVYHVHKELHWVH